MHITLETDYAIRIVDCLARHSGRMGASQIAEESKVTLRFSLKILRKLVGSGMIRSFKGAQGGYEVARPLEEISVYDIIETIEGPYMLNRCLYEEHECNRIPDKRCPYHNLYANVSEGVRAQLKEMTMDKMIAQYKELQSKE